ncbi:hypothetical protein AQZ52_13980 [Novosphingobium fuchskuhlense]|uniref:Uncharacterized protein n=2 Tax=Novosphingobium fuchskuhlense TaxID=1117702 RepID=A0A117UU70_9SPHN|nr:hypothetical protein AQZ52_13980 [Novosphingobium fuchskuhlense]
MHVARGLGPGQVDDQVRFQTTYYFRTFDYCWDAHTRVKLGEDNNEIDYRQIVPQTDTLYRYRMTGKASAMFNKIRFESGTMKASEIDPFGKSVKIEDEDKGADKDAAGGNVAGQIAPATADQLNRIRGLTDYYNALADPAKAKLGPGFLIDLQGAITAFLANPTVSNPDLVALKAEVSKLSGELAQTKADLLARIDDAEKAILAKVGAAPGAAAATPQDGASSQFCQVGEKLARGFQIMGPEGIRTFKQDERLVMAMTTSSAPLIATMQEYSSRVLSSKGANMADANAITTEMLHTMSALRVLADARRAEAEPAAIYDQVIAAFDPPAPAAAKIPSLPRLP